MKDVGYLVGRVNRHVRAGEPLTTDDFAVVSGAFAPGLRDAIRDFEAVSLRYDCHTPSCPAVCLNPEHTGERVAVIDVSPPSVALIVKARGRR